MAATGHRKQGHSRLHAPLPKPASVTFSYFADPTLPEKRCRCEEEASMSELLHETP